MIERYTLPEMGKIWSDQSRFAIWLKVEVFACEAQAALGLIPKSALKEITARAGFDVDRINAIEAEVNHDVIAFLTSVAEHVGEASRYIHFGLTSSDVLDTALSVQIQQAGRLIQKELEALLGETGKSAWRFAKTPTMGRTHGVFAEPMALGQKFAIIERIALEVRHLQRSEVREMLEGFTARQKGSSAMPHKRNPILCERLCGMARLLRSYAQTGFENIALWHERDISHSSVERVTFPDATAILYYMLKKARGLLAGLEVDPERMLANVQSAGGVVFSQRVLLALVEAGMSREEAYRIVQKHALKAWNENGSFRKLVSADPKAKGLLSARALAACFDLAPYMAHAETILKRAVPKHQRAGSGGGKKSG